MTEEEIIQTRSLLADNVDTLLEHLSVMRSAKKNDAEDLFGAETDANTAIAWKKNIQERSKLEILLNEKESLGLYVSGNPLDDYIELINWCRQTSGRDDIYLVIIDKIKKIFTRSNMMMFALQISSPGLDVEGVIFPKRALDLSPKLVEKELFWIKGKISDKKNGAKKIEPKEEAIPENEVITTEDGEIPIQPEVETINEYEEKPKLLIDDVSPFVDGVLPLFQYEDIKLAINRKEALDKVNWAQIRQEPSKFNDFLDGSGKTKIEANTAKSVKVLRLSKELGKEALAKVRAELKHESGNNRAEVYVEVEGNEGYKRAKGTFWIDLDTVKHNPHIKIVAE